MKGSRDAQTHIYRRMYGYRLFFAPEAFAQTAKNCATVLPWEALQCKVMEVIAGVRIGVVTVHAESPKGGGSIGSGFLIGNDTVVTNYHVIHGAKTKGISVVFLSGKKIPATVIGEDPLTDIALLKMDTGTLPKKERLFTTVAWGNSNALRQGSWVIAMGSPYGLEDSATLGIVSSVNRTIDSNTGGSPYVPYIQTDAAVNLGNSGGPLFNLKGEVVGINSLMYSNGGIALSIPSSLASHITLELQAHGRVRRGFIGAEVTNLSEADIWMRGLPNTDGVLIKKVTEGMPAHRAGMREGDVLLSWNSIRILTVAGLLRTLAQEERRFPVPVKVWRGTRSITLWVAPIERPKELHELDKKKYDEEEEDKKEKRGFYVRRSPLRAPHFLLRSFTIPLASFF